jgi:hypothetical protein
MTEKRRLAIAAPAMKQRMTTLSSVRVLFPLLPPIKKSSGFADDFVVAATAMTPVTR